MKRMRMCDSSASNTNKKLKQDACTQNTDDMQTMCVVYKVYLKVKLI